MSKYTVVCGKRIIGYDTATHKVIVYEPQEASLTNLSEEELEALTDCIEALPEGGIYNIKDL